MARKRTPDARPDQPDRSGAPHARPNPDGAIPGSPNPDGANPGSPNPDGAIPDGAIPVGSQPGGDMGPAGLRALENLQQELGYRFRNPGLLLEAVTHSTFAYEQRRSDIVDNERLEFLGDAVLDLVISHSLYLEPSHFAEGFMTKARALVVCEPTLAKAARAIGLGGYLRLGRGEEATGGRNKPSNLSNAIEAILGAAFQDGGMDAAGAIARRLLAGELQRALSGRLVYDHKSRLIELVQGSLPASTLRFVIIREEGPVHERIFTACVLLDDRSIGEGTGSSKKEAEQQAAHEALKTIGKEPEEGFLAAGGRLVLPAGTWPQTGLEPAEPDTGSVSD